MQLVKQAEVGAMDVEMDTKFVHSHEYRFANHAQKISCDKNKNKTDSWFGHLITNTWGSLRL